MNANEERAERMTDDLEQSIQHGLVYSVDLKSKTKGHRTIMETLLPFAYSARAVALTNCFMVSEVLLPGECYKCEMAGHPHVLVQAMRDHTWHVCCTVLFHDLIKPFWKLSEVK